MKTMQYLSNTFVFSMALIVLGCLAGCAEKPSGAATSDGSEGQDSRSAMTVGAMELTPNSAYPARSFYTGRVEPSRRSDLGFELGGQLHSVTVEEGALVSAGELLARLDTDRIDAQASEARARVAQAQAQTDLAASTLARLVEAREFDGVSAQELDEAKNRATTAEAALMAAKAQAQRIQVDLSKMQLLAPYDAVVLSRHFDEGQVLNPGQPVLSVQENTRLEVRIGIAGPAADTLIVGQEYPLLVNERPMMASLRSVVPVRSAVSRTVDAVFELETGKQAESQSGITRAGDLAQLELRRTLEVAGYWVPLTALAEGERGLWNAYVLVRAASESLYTVESRAVEVLYQDGLRAYIDGALQPGELMVPSGLNRIVPGQQVRIEKDGI